MSGLEYVKMTASEAVKLVGGDATVYVAIGRETDCVADFTRRKFCECEGMIRNGESIQYIVDDFISQLNVLNIPTKHTKNIAVILLPPNN